MNSYAPFNKPVLHRPVELAQYTSTQLADAAEELGVLLSVGRTGVCWDNAQIESFWSTLKTEFYDRYSFATRTEARSNRMNQQLPKGVDDLVALLDSGESALAYNGFAQCTVGAWQQYADVLLSNQRILIQKPRLFGRRIDHQLRLLDVGEVRYGPLNGVGPAWDPAENHKWKVVVHSVHRRRQL